MITVIDYNSILSAEMQGIYGDYVAKVNQINRWYAIYSGEQEWQTAEGLDYTPTKKITNIIKQLIDRRARFMFGKEPYFDIRSVKPDAKGQTTLADKAQEKEDLLHQILNDNKFHSKLLKAKKTVLSAGRWP